jgi:hypothetical protein
MRFIVTGISNKTQQEVSITIRAFSQKEAEEMAMINYDLRDVKPKEKMKRIPISEATLIAREAFTNNHPSFNAGSRKRYFC